jgi:hypothetical protein
MRRHAHQPPAPWCFGGSIELRTNWRVYAEEFAERCGSRDARHLDEFVADDPLTLLERACALGHACGAVLWMQFERGVQSV